MKRVSFCGSIIGSVTLREGETDADAIARAEATLLSLFDRHARSLAIKSQVGEGVGPNVCLEPNELDDSADD